MSSTSLKNKRKRYFVERMKFFLLHKIKRCKEFQALARRFPETLYHHRTHGWQYIPVHPFADESEILLNLEMHPADCIYVDARWYVNGDVVFLQVSAMQDLPFPYRLSCHQAPGNTLSMYLTAQVQARFLTRDTFEKVMSCLIRDGILFN